jgi:predicted nucleic acid-binding Zn ribbon protein
MSLRPKALRRRSEWFKPGDLARMVLDILRLASTPLSIKDITVQVMQRRGLDPADARTTQLMRKLIHNALNRQAAELVEKVAEDGVVARRWRCQ